MTKSFGHEKEICSKFLFALMDLGHITLEISRLLREKPTVLGLRLWTNFLRLSGNLLPSSPV